MAALVLSSAVLTPAPLPLIRAAIGCGTGLGRADGVSGLSEMKWARLSQPAGERPSPGRFAQKTRPI
jgi:hypothetical protein